MLSEDEAKRQLEQMREFILQEARENAERITFKTQQDYVKQACPFLFLASVTSTFPV